MYDSYYKNEESARFNSYGGQNEPDDDVDYSFTRLSVMERRKLFQDGQPPPELRNAGTLPRSFGSHGRYSGAHSDQGDWNRSVRRTSSARLQTYQRPDVYIRPSVTGRTLQLSPKRNDVQYAAPPPQRMPNYSTHNGGMPGETINEQLIQPSFAPPRQSRQTARPTSAVTTYRVYGTPTTPTPVTKVLHRSTSYNSPGPRLRDSTSLTHEVMPTMASVPQESKPLRVRVYNSDRNMLSPSYTQGVSNWSPTSPIYPAYPAYGPRPTGSNSQFYRVVQSPQKQYPHTIEKSYNFAPLTVPVSPRQRQLTPIAGLPQKSITIVPSGGPRDNRAPQSSYIQPSQIQPDFIQPIHAQPTRSMPTRIQPMHYQPTRIQPSPPGSMTPTPVRSNPGIYQPGVRGPRRQPMNVQRYAPQPQDEDAGISEF